MTYSYRNPIRFRLEPLVLVASLFILSVAAPSGEGGARRPFPGVASGGVSANGRLRVVDGTLTNRDGRPVQLRGMSSHGLQWYPEFTNARAMQTIASYGANLFRVAMYADSTDGGYTESANAARRNRAWLRAAVENALSADLYVIVDWHILRDENPLRSVDAARAFFDDMSSRLANEPGVLYEICNEPNGETTWEDVKKYAEQIIPVIRKNAPHSVIIVGTPKYSTDLRSPFEKPLAFDNVMYALHAYTGHIDTDFESILSEYVRAKFPIFVTEWGISDDEDRDNYGLAVRMVDFFDKNNLSWSNWSLSNKDESYSAIKPGVTKLSGWTDEDLTFNGKFVFSRLARAIP